MKAIRPVLTQISRQSTYDIPAIDKFLKSRRGEAFVLKLGIKNISILEKEMHAPKLYTNPLQRLGLWKNRAKALGLLPDRVPEELRVKEILNYDKMRAKKAKQGLLKPPPQLGHYAIQKAFMRQIERDSEGRPVQKKDRFGRLLWEKDGKGGERPVYKYTIQTNTKKGLRDNTKIQSYINHSVEKWARKNPHPESFGPLFNDQFAQEMCIWNMRMKVYRDYITKIMTERYGHQTTKTIAPFRMYALYKGKGVHNKPVYYEQECNDPLAWGYPLINMRSIADLANVRSTIDNLVEKRSGSIPQLLELHLVDSKANVIYKQAA